MQINVTMHFYYPSPFLDQRRFGPTTIARFVGDILFTSALPASLAKNCIKYLQKLNVSTCLYKVPITAVWWLERTNTGKEFKKQVHSGYFYSAFSSPLLLLKGTPDTARILCRSFTPKRHRQL